MKTWRSATFNLDRDGLMMCGPRWIAMTSRLTGADDRYRQWRDHQTRRRKWCNQCRHYHVSVTQGTTQRTKHPADWPDAPSDGRMALHRSTCEMNINVVTSRCPSTSLSLAVQISISDVASCSAERSQTTSIDNENMDSMLQLTALYYFYFKTSHHVIMCKHVPIFTYCTDIHFHEGR